MNTRNQPSREQIERRAYEMYLERGCEDGQDLTDWLAAEQELSYVSATTMGAAMSAAVKLRKRAAVA